MPGGGRERHIARGVYLDWFSASTLVENNIIFSVLAFMLVYGASVIVITMLLTFSGMDVLTAFTATIACINNTGPGLNQVGPATNFGGLTDFETWVCTFAMLIGRLELLSVLVLSTFAAGG